MYKVGDKLYQIDRWDGQIKEMYVIIRVNKLSYTVGYGFLVNKERMNDPYGNLYLFETEELNRAYLQKETMRLKLKYLDEFNNAVKKAKETIKFFIEHKDMISLNDSVVEDLESALEYLLEEVKE